MKTKLRLPKQHLASIGLLAAAGLTLYAAPFFLPVTYQGRLDAAGLPANGNYELQVGLFNAASGGSPVQLLTNTITISNGLFTTVLQLDGTQLQDANTDWLELGVRTNGSPAAFTILAPRQQVTYAPLAARADVAGIANDFPQGAVNSYHILDGSIAALDIDSGQVVKSVNGLKDAVTLAAGAGITITPTGNTLTISNAGWNLNGNAGANPTNGAFLGTTDNLPFEIKVNGKRALRIEEATSGLSPNLVGGHSGNIVSNGLVGGFIGGGGSVSNPHRVGGNYASVIGGFGNTASGDSSTAMGAFTAASGAYSTAMGYDSTASSAYSTAMGVLTTASGFYSTAMGYYSTASGNSSISMGASTTASGVYSTAMGYVTTASGNSSISMGASTTASGDYSTAMGYRAKANHQGAFVWADSQNADFASAANNQFLIRASGGVGINTNNPAGAALAVVGGIRAGVNGTVQSRVQFGTATVGTGVAGVNTFTITFPTAFTSVPKVFVTAKGNDTPDTFAISTRAATAANFKVNIVRIDVAAGWGQTLQVDWYAVE